jgi:hypothetical protein
MNLIFLSFGNINNLATSPMKMRCLTFEDEEDMVVEGTSPLEF